MKSLSRISALSLIAFVLLFGREVRAQGVSSSGTDYWMTFMPNGTPDQYGGYDFLHLFIASSTNNSVKVTVGGSVRTFSMQPNTVLDVTLDNSATTMTPEVPTGNATHVTSTNPITIYGYNVWASPNTLGGSPDGFLALPITSYGTKYITVNYDASQFGSAPSSGEFAVIAPYDNTQVTFVTKGDTRSANNSVSHKAGVPWSVTLRKGETYLVQSDRTTPAENDLTGSLVTSDLPIALVTGHQITPITLGVQTSADHLCEMMPPVDRWGTQYFDMPMAGRTVCGDYIRVISAEDGNQITYNGRGPFLLNAGEFAERTEVNQPEVYTSINHKKFVVMQYSYSQGFDGDPGTADPFMILMTAQEQFQKSMVFRTPVPANSGTFNNYITFIAQDDQIKNIKINGLALSSYQYVGHQQFPNTNPVMGGYRVKLPGGARSYFAEAPVPFGAYQYGFAFYEGYGWPTGMAQKIISPDTLPPLGVILDSNCGTYDLRFNEPRLTSNGFSFNDTKIASLSLITDPGDARWATPSFNYTFTPSLTFNVGDSVATGTLTVNDLTKDAYAAIYAVDLAGNDSVYQYHYFAPQVAISPTAQPYTFNSVLLDADSCKTVTFSNVQKAGNFLAQFAKVKGGSIGGTFTVTPTTLGTIAAGKSVDLTICYHASDTGQTSIDTLLIQGECLPYRYALQGSAVTPLIYAEDVNFGEVDSGKTLCKDLKLSNPGKAPLTITKQDLANDPDFSVDPSTKFPIVIPPGGSATISYCFHPTHSGAFQSHVLFTDRNPVRYTHSIKDTSVLVGQALVAGAKLSTYVKDFGSPSCTDKPVLLDTIYNDLTKDKEVVDIKIVGPDAKYFQITSSLPTLPFGLQANQANNIPVSIQFDPMLNGLDFTVRNATLQVYVKNDDGSTGLGPAAGLKGVLTSPLVQTDVASLNLGQTQTGKALSKTFIIFNKGTAPLPINSYNLTGADAGVFKLSPAPPFTVPAGGQIIVTVTAQTQPTDAARQYDASLALTNVCTSISLPLRASYSNTSDVALGTVHPKTYVGGCRSNEQNASFQNLSSSDTLTLLSANIVGTTAAPDANDFSLKSVLSQQAVAPNALVNIPIVFVPTSTGPKSAELQLMLRGKAANGTDSTWTETVILRGEGVNVVRRVAVGSIATAPAYSSQNNVRLDVPVVVDSSIEQNAPNNGTTEVYGYRFTLNWKRDAFKYLDAANAGSVAVTASPEAYDATTGLASITFTGVSKTPIQNVVKLSSIGFLPRLNVADTTPIGISNVQWLDATMQPTCYVATTLSNQAFELQPECGSVTIQHLLRGDNIATSLDRISPNPVHSNAHIAYHLKQDATVTITVYDVMGTEVTRLVDQEAQKKGDYTVILEGEKLSSGTYFCRLSDGKQTTTRQFSIEK